MRTFPADTRVLPASRLASPSRGRSERQTPSHAEIWSPPNLQGRLVELSEERELGALSFAVSLFGAFRDPGKPAIWVSCARPLPFPPDIADAGIPPAGFPLVTCASATDTFFALETLLKTRAFGIIVADLGPTPADDAVLGKLQKLAAGGRTAVLFLSEKPELAPSLSSLISLRGHIVGQESDGTAFTVRTLRDRYAPPAGDFRAVCRVPRGLP